MDENLIGYLLEALEPDEREQVEAFLRCHADAQARVEQLRRLLAPLSADAAQPEPPPWLATSTLARIAEHRCLGLPQAPPLRSSGPLTRRWPRRADLIAAAVLFVVFGGLAGTWLVRGWQDSQRLACQNSLQTYWQALQLYSGQNEGRFPQVAETGSRSLASMFVPVLAEAGCLPPEKRTVCAPQPVRSGRPPTLQELEELWRQRHGAEFQQQAQALAGNYAYSLGYLNNGTLQGLGRGEDTNRPIMADHRPALSCGLENSPNHGGSGQNVLFVGGHARWYTSPAIAGDNIYLNNNQKVLAGLGHEDAVLGAGDTSPCPRPD